MQPRVVVAGVQSGVGKTTLATGIMAALRRRGYQVQGFKVGPDYIDPGYHTAATGRISRNLDGWMLSGPTLRELFIKATAEADIAVIEGVMGLYDGLGRRGGVASTAHIARELKSPVVLVVDAKGMSTSAAAVALGYKQFDRQVDLRGVIFNRVGGEGHYRLLQEAVEKETGLRALGYLPEVAELSLPERHLGLLSAAEKRELAGFLKRLAEVVTATVDLQGLVEIAQEAPPLEVSQQKETPQFAGKSRGREKVRIAVAKDEAFNFYYQDGLEVLEAYGAEIVFFSPLHDKALPDGIQGLYIGGGFPEMFLEQLAGNHKMRDNVATAFYQGLPIYAECGGLMYLAQEIIDFAGQRYPMVGVVPGKARMQKKAVALGYAEAEVITDNLLARRGEIVRGHQFHWSTLEEVSPFVLPAYRLTAARTVVRAGEGVEEVGGKAPRGNVSEKKENEKREEKKEQEGIVLGNLLASYLHVHFAGCPRLAQNFVESCRRYQQR